MTCILSRRLALEMTEDRAWDLWIILQSLRTATLVKQDSSKDSKPEATTSRALFIDERLENRRHVVFMAVAGVCEQILTTFSFYSHYVHEIYRYIIVAFPCTNFVIYASFNTLRSTSALDTLHC